MPAFSTPMMQQYAAIKERYSDCLLFFRLGDFYELFLEDARVGARVLNITLTKRPRGKDGDIPMAGVPYHAADSYIAKLVKAGYKVAICEQISQPDTRGIVEREVIRVVTPGTIFDEKTLPQKEHNYVMSISFDDSAVGIAVADISTGDLHTTEIPRLLPIEQIIHGELVRFGPVECILSDKMYEDTSLLKLLSLHEGLNVFPFKEWIATPKETETYLKKNFNIKSLASFGIEEKPHCILASGNLLRYLTYTQQSTIHAIKRIAYYSPEDYVILDPSTVTNLELFKTLRDQEIRGSFLSIIDHTITPMGGRELRQWVRKPLRDKNAIARRLNTVEELVSAVGIRNSLRKRLEHLYDIERITGRLCVGLGSAIDLVNLKISLSHTLEFQKEIASLKTPYVQEVSRNIPKSISKIIDFIEKRIVDNPPFDTKEGGLIKEGYYREVDRLRSQVMGGKEWLLELEQQEKIRTGINSLKVRFNQVFGYYIEISKANLMHVPKEYIRKQTMVGAERFITPELKKHEEKAVAARERLNKLEYEIFCSTVKDVLSYTEDLQNTAKSIAIIDCLLNLAHIAQLYRYTRPGITDTGEISITGGRHPVVEHLIDAQFVPNTKTLNTKDQQILIITGPNMVGKSVFLRQTALLTLLAHMGSFVPASSARISLVDRIFVRSGASDVITKGLSTFMVEMSETAHIINHATKESLIIMDEIGRGTSTYDGVSIAWAVAEYIATHIGAKTLFATHYHELQKLEDEYPHKIQNYHVLAQEKNGEPIFLHTVVKGKASHSYGIAVAGLAGIPKEITDKARALLSGFENNKAIGIHTQSKTLQKKDITGSIENIDINSLTPLEALQKLAELKKILEERT